MDWKTFVIELLKAGAWPLVTLTVALDEPHGVVGAAAVVGPQAVDRDDPGVFQTACDLSLDAKRSPAAAA